MNKKVRRFVSIIALALVLTFSFSVTSKASTDFPDPDVFDFGDMVISVNAGASHSMYLYSKYNYVCYVGDHTSNQTYCECSCKAGYENIVFHIGLDETVKNVFFFFYVDQDGLRDGSKYATVETYVQNINTSLADPSANVLKAYAGNNAEFNAYFYYVNYPDLQRAFGLNGDALLNHYNTYGKAERRVANKIK
ncbi:hypothetical protein [Butyrivibrio sp. YAB3001]|uniref:hypothetical protein n=1 Tax=Butyrivibrio sp. YAB3001 TaxID=1520812 RepID=UPI000B8958A4|nr:hypothetical protein [Butyrivibrio sp. YAB3001]